MSRLVTLQSAGYTLSRGASANPNLWKNLELAYSREISQTSYNLRDLSGHGETLAPSVPTFVHPAVGKYGKCWRHEDNTQAQFNAGNAPDAGMRDWSVLAAFRYDSSASSQTRGIFGRLHADASYHKWGLYYKNTDQLFSIFDTGGGPLWALATGNMKDNKWHVAAGVYDRDGDHQFWLDGALLKTQDMSADDGVNATGGSAALRIGFYQGSRSMAGETGPCYAWSRVLTPTEILQQTLDPHALFRRRPVTAVVAAAAPAQSPAKFIYQHMLS